MRLSNGILALDFNPTNGSLVGLADLSRGPSSCAFPHPDSFVDLCGLEIDTGATVTAVVYNTSGTPGAVVRGGSWVSGGGGKMMLHLVTRDLSRLQPISPMVPAGCGMNAALQTES